jgi:hypothetical protein
MSQLPGSVRTRRPPCAEPPFACSLAVSPSRSAPVPRWSWAEIPLVNSITNSAGFRANAEQQLREMVRQNYNHPSVVVWGIGNEQRTDDTATNALLDDLAGIVTAVDQDRVSTYAHNGSITSGLVNHTEVDGYNRYHGWYYGSFNGRNDKGLVTYDRATRKDAFYWYKANWTTTPFVYVTSRRWTDRTSPTTTVKVYGTADSVRLAVNGVQVGAPKTSTSHIYSWPNVTLSPGANTVQVTGTRGSTTYSDGATWTLR